MKQIDQRLRGFSKKNKILLPLSIEGEVHQLITVKKLILFKTFIKVIKLFFNQWTIYFGLNFLSNFQEATDIDNLSRMYIGWAAHL